MTPKTRLGAVLAGMAIAATLLLAGVLCCGAVVAGLAYRGVRSAARALRQAMGAAR